MRKLIVAAMVAIMALTVVACDGDKENSANKQRQSSVQFRTNTFARAQDKYPLPRTENFPLRQTLVEMTKREDKINHPWYVYVLGDNGNTIGYYVAKTTPINACDFLSSTESILWDDEGGNIKTTAPSLDGIFYGGGGSSSGCDVWVWLDYSSNALIKVRDVKFFTADAPLSLDVSPIEVAK